jgi:hypothetical protein
MGGVASRSFKPGGRDAHPVFRHGVRDCAARGALPGANVNDIFDVFATGPLRQWTAATVTPHGGGRIPGFGVLPIATKLM